MKEILVVAGTYLPGYKGGGLVRGLANLIESLGNEFAFSVLTSDRDWGTAKPYPGVRRGEWRTVGKAKVRYLAPHERGIFHWRELLRTTDYDLVYLNSFFSTLTVMTLVLRRFKQIPITPAVLFPHGEFSPGALSLKHIKKRAYLSVAKYMRLCDGVVWQASSDYERQDVLDVLGRRIGNTPPVVVAPYVPPAWTSWKGGRQRPDKQAGSARIVFLSRISRIKNLDAALRLLATLNRHVQFDIYGPVEDEGYWQECQALIKRLPPEVQVNYLGPVNPDQVIDVFSHYHLFLLPSGGENFGYVILESLVAGCPVLISDQTPWRDLEKKGVGWDVPLADSTRFRACINRCIEMDDGEFQMWSEKSRALALDHISVTQRTALDSHRLLFSGRAEP